MKSIILAPRVPVDPVTCVIFLDIDGVLNAHDPSASGFAGTGRIAVRRFNQLLARYPGAGVVLSSSWRYLVHSGVMTLNGLEDCLCTHGLDLRGRLLGILDTDESLKADWDRGARRLALILQWLTLKNVSSLPWVALDDTPIPDGRAVHVDGFTGLTVRDILKASAILDGGAK